MKYGNSANSTSIPSLPALIDAIVTGESAKRSEAPAESQPLSVNFLRYLWAETKMVKGAKKNRSAINT